MQEKLLARCRNKGGFSRDGGHPPTFANHSFLASPTNEVLLVFIPQIAESYRGSNF